LKSVLLRKYVVTTDSKHKLLIAENTLNREFKSYNLVEKWVSDITYIRVKNSWCYLTTIMDLANRQIIGWTLSPDMTKRNTVYKAYTNARKNRDITYNHIFHSDRVSQYASSKMRRIFEHNKKINQSMSGKGNCWDNALAESFFKSIKHEWLYRFSFKNIFEAYYQVKASLTGTIMIGIIQAWNTKHLRKWN
jgi:putative transposase